MNRIALAGLLGFVCVATAALAGGDAKRGEAVFGRCAMCHNADKGGGNGLGPNLFGVAGHKAAAVADFYYSPALKNAHLTWTDDKLHAWLANPQKLVPGTRMVFAGIKSPQEIDDVIAYLHQKH
jgi:cytochrome c